MFAAKCAAVLVSLIVLPAISFAQVNEAELKAKVAQAVRMLAAEGLVGSSGHVSARIPGTNRVLINSRDASREMVQPDDIVTVDLEGKKIDGKDREPDETAIHVAIYRARSDVHSVIHTHALYSTAFTIAQKPILPVSVHGAIFADGVPEYKEAGKVMERKEGDALAKALGSHRAVLMRMHGAVVVGAYVEEAFCAAIQLEENAKLQITAAALGAVNRMTPEEVTTAIKESWMPNSIRKRWEYYAAREKK
jgi:L-ribulose-5-phosphate 4-epimerase